MAARRPRVYDTNAYIAALRAREPRALAGPLVWLSAVVVSELLAGAKTTFEERDIRELVDSSRRRGRLLIPTGQDWLQAGELIGRYSRQHGALKPRDHFADVLICLAAARIAGEVVTANLVDFRRWARMLRQSGGDVGVTDTL
ncbi:MAG: PIN domain-containing protein [Chloroflexi bacterium]|nr:PIN domain-containing protein [Chloroflexota bacterium]MBV9598823.1 PIN domain-containing protein [Chloroflexota bacterium]